MSQASNAGKSHLVVAMFGFYGYGNFGDDLAAVIFCRHLEQLGVIVRVHGLCQPYAQAFNLNVVHTVEDLLEGAHMVLLGGGGALVSHRRPSWLHTGMLSKLPEMGRTSEQIVAGAKARGIPVYGLSLGGDGRLSGPLVPTHKRRFVEAAKLITVRNRTDVAMLESHGHKAIYYPDIIWQTGTVFPAVPEHHRRLRVGVNLYLSNLIGVNIMYALALRSIVRRRRDIDFVFIETANTVKNKFGAISLRGTANLHAHIFNNPLDDLALISSLDLVISSRLHLGIAAMSYGVPFLSIGGEGKTRTMMKELGFAELCFGPSHVCRFTRLMRTPENIGTFIATHFHVDDALAYASQSKGHLDQLSTIVENLSQRRT